MLCSGSGRCLGLKGGGAGVSSVEEVPAQCNYDLTQEIVLRGLPHTATEKDIRQFLGPFVNMLIGDTPIQFISSRRNRPPGFAKIQLNSPESARDACKCLHNCLMFDRYIEVFLASDKRCKNIVKMLAVADSASAVDAVKRQEDRSAVVQECRDFMDRPGCNPLLLSRLGCALSNTSRLLLRRANQSLKQLLGEHPKEFEIDGPWQKQTVRRVSMPAPSGNQPSESKSSNTAMHSNNGSTTPNHGKSGIIELHHLLGFSSMEVRSAWREAPFATNFDGKPPPETPKLESRNIPWAALQTPSNWGTPSTPRDQDSFSHNLQNIAHGLQSQWAVSSNRDSILEIGCSSTTTSAEFIHALASMDTTPTWPTQSSDSLSFERGDTWRGLFEFLSGERSKTDNSSHAPIQSIERNYHSPEPSTNSFSN